MRLADLRKKPLDQKDPRRVGRGRGSGWGCTSGRGNKGAGARAGAGGREYFEGGGTPLYRRLPKRGFNNANFRVEYQVVNVEALNRFESGAEVGPQALHEAGLISNPESAVKVLGRGTVRVALKVAAQAFSESAVQKIQKSGGETKIL